VKIIVALFLLVYGPLFAESFTVEFVETSISSKPNDELIAEAVITNLTNDLITVTCVRESNDLPENWTSSLCFKQCLLPWISTISDSIPADSSLNFSIHFFTDSIPGEGQVNLSFSSANNSEKIEFVIKASTKPTGFVKQNIENKSLRLKGNYPNPFNSFTIIELEAPPTAKRAILYIYDINGQQVDIKDIRLTGGGSAAVRLDVGQIMASGTYFYNLQVITADKSRHSASGKFILIR
jgi:hypothetical protein